MNQSSISLKIPSSEGLQDSDPATKKRIQNRIAQRNYRRNQKRRIAELERHVAGRMGQEYPGGYNYGQSYDAAWLGQEPSFSQGESDHNIQLTPPEIRRQSFPVPPPHLDRILPPALDTDSNPIGDIVFSNEPRTKISDSVQTISRNKVLNNPVNDYTILFNSTPEAVLNQEFGEDLRKKGEGGWHSNLLVEDMDSSSTSRDHDTPQEDDNQDCSEVSSDQRNARQTRNLTNNISLANSRCHASQIASLNTSTSSPKISESATSEISAEAFIEDRFAYVLQSARKCGFDSLEAMITTYYVSDFSDNPALANAQRLGRNRQLPGIIAGLRGSIDSWSTWEAQGCKEEVLKFSEQVLLNEYRGNARSHDLRRFLGTLNGLDRKGVPEDEHSRKEHVSKVGKLYQDELPNLWAFINTLSDNQPPSAPGVDNTHSLLAAICLYYLSSRASSERL